MILLDESIGEDQAGLLRDRRITVRQIGRGLAAKGFLDEALLPLLHALRRPTFFTRDRDFFRRNLVHPRYCIVYLDVADSDTARFIRRFLRHAEFRTEHAEVRFHAHCGRRDVADFFYVGICEGMGELVPRAVSIPSGTGRSSCEPSSLVGATGRS